MELKNRILVFCKVKGYILIRVDRGGQITIRVRQEEANKLVQRLADYLDSAVAQGEPPYYFVFQARLQMLQGKQDAAMGSLRLAWQNYSLDWTDLLYPELAPLRSRPEYVELRESMQLHLNSERAKLGWEPVEL